MTRRTRLPAALITTSILLLLSGCSSSPETHTDPAEDVAKTTIIHAGDQAPDIVCELLGGGSFDLADHRGQVVLVNFFATWCAPCQAEMPFLHSRVWTRFSDPDFAMVSIAREESADVVAPFVDERLLPWPFALDPEREAFGRYATAYIPRNFVIDRQGKVIFQSQGFEMEEFEAMVEILSRELEGP